MEKLILTLTRVNEDKEEVLVNEEMDSIAVIGECYNSDKIMELLAHVSIKNIAGMIMQSEKFIKAAKLAVVGRKILEAVSEDDDPEQGLADQIMGGLQ